MSDKKRINIFIVEDNYLFRTALASDIESFFDANAVKVHSFETGEACMKKYRQENPQVVILDYHLNSKNLDAADGIQVLDWIKRENREANVIMLSSEDSMEIVLRSFEHGALNYIVKTETKFKQINNSLINLFNRSKDARDAVRYRQIGIGLALSIAILIVGVIAIKIFNPSLLQ